MLTVCPKCTLTLAVTAVDLRLGQGYVRCGRCSDVFNALLSLREETLTDSASTQPQPVLRVEELEAAEAAAAEAAAIKAEPAAAEHAAPAPEPLFEEIDLLAEPPPDEAEPDEAEEEEFADSESQDPLDAVEPVPEPAEIFEVVFEPGAAPPAPEEEPEPEPEDIEIIDVDDEPEHAFGVRAMSSATAPELQSPSDITAVHLERPLESGHRRRTILYAAAITLASLLLIAQGIHHWRNSIASHPDWYPLMSRLYSALGLRLTPDWNLSNYDLQQLGAASYAVSDQTLWIKLQLGNRGQRALPWPALRLNLSDRYGKRVATRILQPREYLTPGNTAEGFLQPAQKILTEVGVIGPVAATSSFELDVCLPAAGGVRCANDAVLGPPAHS